MMNLIKTKTEKGFTLIELMIVVAIIGILAAIAIPQFSAYRIKAFNSASESDLRNLMTSQEAAFADTQQYVDFGQVGSDTTVTNTITSLPGAKLSQRVKADSASTTLTAYTMQTKHIQGDTIFTGSDAAGIVPNQTSGSEGTALF